MKKDEIKSLFEKFDSLAALVVGDIMIDSYIWGKVDRLSPEAPVPVVHVQRKENRLGGAANVALNVQSLGAKAIICSVLGDDANAEVLKSILNREGFSENGLVLSDSRSTTVKTRVISSGQHIVRIDEETTEPLNPVDEEKLIARILQLLDQTKIDVIILEDYNKGVLTSRVIESIIHHARARNIPTAVDPKKDNFLAFKRCTLFKPNLKELKEGLKFDFDKLDSSSLHKAISKLEEILGNEISLVTLSELGVAYSGRNEFHIIPAHEREILDVSGAGDTVISVAALALAGNADIQTIAALSNLAGGLVCESVGVVSISKSKLLSEANNLVPS